MKPRLLIIGLAIAFACTMQAQVSVNVNIGTRPAWGPVVESDIRYYYLPELDMYYDIHTSMFIYFHGKKWIHKKHLPHKYRHYNLHRGRKIVVYDYNGNRPYIYCKYHKNDYNHKHGRTIIEHPDRGHYRERDIHRNSHDRIYRTNDRYHDTGNVKYAHGHGKDKDHGKGRRD